MAVREISANFPVDEDGFFRRECPVCERQFKVIAESRSSSPAPTSVGDSYFCPYCAKNSAVNAFWTKEQGEYMQGVAVDEVLGPELDRLTKAFKGLERASAKSPLKITVTQKGSLPSRPQSLKEQNDMVRLQPPCHPEPIKISETWTQEVACIVCGKVYPRAKLSATT